MFHHNRIIRMDFRQSRQFLGTFWLFLIFRNERIRLKVWLTLKV